MIKCIPVSGTEYSKKYLKNFRRNLIKVGYYKVMPNGDFVKTPKGKLQEIRAKKCC